MTARTGAALLVTAALLLTGCSGGDDEPSSRPSDTASSTATDQDAEGLPAGFPSDEVPLVDGEVGEVLENPARGSYLVKIYPDTDFAAAFADASAQLVGAGFEQGPDVISAGPTSSTADFTSPDWFVVITGGMPDRTMVQYTIYPNE